MGARPINKEFKGQMKTVFTSLSEQPKTMLMVSIETGILRSNICRYVAVWRELNKIAVFKNTTCTISKRKADYLTTDPNLFKESNQLEMFD